MYVFFIKPLKNFDICDIIKIIIPLCRICSDRISLQRKNEKNRTKCGIGRKDLLETAQTELTKHIKRILFSEEEIQAKIAEVGRQVSIDYAGKPLLLVSILNGAFIFMADFCRALTIPCEIAFMCAKSYYAGTESSGEVTITKDLVQDISGYHVIIVEDIIDTGRTLAAVVELLKKRGPLSLEVISLLDKPSRRVVDFNAERTLFTIPDYFVVGYGLDCGEKFRNLPYIAEYSAD